MRRLRSLKVVAAAGLMLTVLIGIEVSQSVAEGFLLAEENQMGGHVNAHRAAHGLPGLAPDPALQMVARRQAQRMSAAGYIYHNPNLAGEAGAAVPNWLRVGENVGVGPSVGRVADAFLASPPHHANIDKSYNRLGLGAVAAANGSLYFTQNFAEVGAPASLAVTPRPAAAAPAPAPPPPARTVCRRRGRRTVCRAAPAPRGRPARRARRGRRTQVRGVELIAPGADGQARSEASLTRTVLGMLSHAADKATFWD